MDELLEALGRFDALRDDPVNGSRDRIAVRAVDSQPPIFAAGDFNSTLTPAIAQSLAATGIQQLYQHQAEAIRLLSEGKDVVLEAPTASGKTLCFSVPLITKFLQNRDARALMLYPMKALANDQRRQFDTLVRNLPGNQGQRIQSWLYDGDTPQDERELIRRNPPQVLLTNPEMLHLTFFGLVAAMGQLSAQPAFHSH